MCRHRRHLVDVAVIHNTIVGLIVGAVVVFRRCYGVPPVAAGQLTVPYANLCASFLSACVADKDVRRRHDETSGDVMMRRHDVRR